MIVCVHFRGHRIVVFDGVFFPCCLVDPKEKCVYFVSRNFHHTVAPSGYDVNNQDDVFSVGLVFWSGLLVLSSFGLVFSLSLLLSNSNTLQTNNNNKPAYKS